MKDKISLAVIRRLPRYYRYLSELQSAGIAKISSKELSEKMGLTASQIRQDLNCFGGFGQQGYGYNVESLFAEISSILGIDNKYRAVMIGVGNLGRAITRHVGFEKRGFKMIGLFDANPDIIGTKVAGHQVIDIKDLASFCEKEKPEAAILTLPREAAPAVAEKLIKLGIRGFWNFSNGDIHLIDKSIPVENVHLGDSLMTLCYRIKEIEER